MNPPPGLGTPKNSRQVIRRVLRTSKTDGRVLRTTRDYLDTLVASIVLFWLNSDCQTDIFLFVYRPGSVIVEFVLYYDKGTTKEEMKSQVKDAFKGGKLGDYDVDKESVGLAGNRD